MFGTACSYTSTFQRSWDLKKTTVPCSAPSNLPLALPQCWDKTQVPHTSPLQWWWTYHQKTQKITGLEYTINLPNKHHQHSIKSKLRFSRSEFKDSKSSIFRIQKHTSLSTKNTMKKNRLHWSFKFFFGPGCWSGRRSKWACTAHQKSSSGSKALKPKSLDDGLTVQPVGQSVGMKGGMENKQLNPKKKPVWKQRFCSWVKSYGCWGMWED